MSHRERLARLAQQEGWPAALDLALAPHGYAQQRQCGDWIARNGPGLVAACAEKVRTADVAALARWQGLAADLFRDIGDDWRAARVTAFFATARAAADATIRSAPSWSTAPIRDLLHAFAGTWLEPAASVRVTVPFAVGASADRSLVAEAEGVLARLRLELVADDHGEIYPDPRTMFFVWFDEQFQGALQAAWDTFAGRTAGMSLRWSLEPFFSEAAVWFSRPLTGPSVGAGCAVGLLALLDSRVAPDPMRAVTGALLDTHGRLGGVGGYELKTLPLARYPDLRLVVPKHQAASVPPDWRPRVDEAADVRRALELATGCMADVLSYLETVVRRAETLPSYYPRGARLQSVRVPPRVGRPVPGRSASRQAAGSASGGGTGFDGLRGATRPGVPEERRDAVRQVLDWDQDVRGTLRRTYLHGGPGTGKSLLLRFEAIRAAHEALAALRDEGRALGDGVALPVLLPLTDVAAALHELPLGQRRLAAAVRRALAALEHGGSHADELLGVIESRVGAGDGSCLLLLDALDEVPELLREGLLRALRAYWREKPQARVLVTSRLGAGREEPWGAEDARETAREGGDDAPDRAGALEILPFDSAQTAEFVTRFFAGDREAARGLLRLIADAGALRGVQESPLLLGLTCCLYRDQGDVDWSGLRRTTLYRAIVTRLLSGVWHEPGDGAGHGCDAEAIEVKLRELGKVAATLFAAGNERCTRAVLLDAIEACLPYLDTPGAAAKIREWRQDGILVLAGSRDDPVYLFPHLAFQEWLTAMHLAAQGRRAASFDGWFAEVILPRVYEPRWLEVLTLLAGALDADLSFAYLDGLRRESSRDLFLRPLQLACRASAEIPRPLRPEHARWLTQLAECVVALHLHGGTLQEDEWRRAVQDLGREATEILRVELRTCPEETRPKVLAMLLQLPGGAEPALAELSAGLSEWAWPRVAPALRLVEDPDAAPQLHRLLNEVPPTFREEIIASLARIKDPLSVPVLIPLLQDPSWDVPGAAAEALVSIGDPAVGPLVRFLEAGGEPRGVELAITALGRLKASGAGPVVRRYLAQEGASHSLVGVKAAATATLGCVEGPASVELLRKSLLSSEAPVRRAAAIALGNLGCAGTPEAMDALCTVLGDDDFWVAHAAAGALAIGRRPEGLPACVELLRSRDSTCRTLVKTLFTDLDIEGVEGPLRELLNADDADLRSDAREMLEARGDPAIIELYEADLAGGDQRKQAHAAVRLARLGVRSAVPTLIGLLDSTFGPARQGAIDGLATLGGPEADAALYRLLQDRRDLHVARRLAERGELDRAIPAFLAALREVGQGTRESCRTLGEMKYDAIRTLKSLTPYIGVRIEAPPTLSLCAFSMTRDAGAGNRSHPDLVRALAWLGIGD